MSKIKDFLIGENEKQGKGLMEALNDFNTLHNILYKYDNKGVAEEIYKINPEYALEIADYIKQLDYNNYLENQGVLWQS